MTKEQEIIFTSCKYHVKDIAWHCRRLTDNDNLAKLKAHAALAKAQLDSIWDCDFSDALNQQCFELDNGIKAALDFIAAFENLQKCLTISV